MTGLRRSPVATRLLQLLAAMAALVVLAASCGSSGDGSSSGGTDAVNQGAPTDEGTPQDGGVLTVGVGADIDGLYPIEARWSLDGNLIGSSMYDTLLTFDEERNLVPRLALSVTPNDDGTVWTMRLRPDVTFHDGTPFDAAAVKANIEARKAVPISGDSLKQVQEAVVVDQLTLDVRMNTPWYGYDYTLAAQGGYMVAPSLIGQEGAMQQAVGTGPFQLDGTWSNGTPVKVKRYEGYWGERAHLDGIEFQALVDQSSRSASLESGDVDLIFTQDPATVKRFRAADGYVQVEDFAAEETFAMLNLGEAPFDNIHARRALAYATNPDAANQSVGGGIQQVANQPYTEQEQYFVEDAGYVTYDPAKAQEEVEAYKAATGASSLSFQFKVPSGGSQKVEAELLQAQWAEVGIEASISETEQSTFLADIFTSNFQACMFRNFAYVNPDSNYIFWHSSFAKQPGQAGGINFGQIRSDKVDDALDTARESTDPDVRQEAYQNVVRGLNEEIAYIWLYHNVWGLAATDTVGGLPTPQRLGFARQDAKPWWPQIWLKQS
jgi:peptide/nickel transport system substrate-binding protein